MATTEVSTPPHPLLTKDSLPPWFTSYRPHQSVAINQILTAFADPDTNLVLLDAPTGTGKSLIAESVRIALAAQAWYLCTTLTLQDQLSADFPDARVLKGRRNYPTRLAPYPAFSAADCDKDPQDSTSCSFCPSVHSCLYELAKRAALSAPLAITNLAYYLTEANYVGRTSTRPLVIIDECDQLESALMSFISFNVPERTLKSLHLHAPSKGSHYTTIASFLADSLIPTLSQAISSLATATDTQSLRTKVSYTRLRQSAATVAPLLTEHSWVRDNDAGPLTLRPVTIAPYAQSNLWRHAPRFLCMSASIISADEFIASTGYTSPYSLISVPSPFPPESSPINEVPVAAVSAKNKDLAYPKIAAACIRIARKHPNDRILIHTVSYELTKYLHRLMSLTLSPPATLLTQSPNTRPVIHYLSSDTRATALSHYRAYPNAILLAPSLDRGIDLPQDLCRVIIIPKIPFLSLGDKQVSARLHSPGGQTWYTVQTVRTLVQMTGRGMRSADDSCTTYILDSQFRDKIYRRHRQLLPSWWKASLNRFYPVKEITGGL